MKGARSSKAHRLITACAAVALLLSLCGVAIVARGWSSFDAYTIVLLHSFDSDLNLLEQLYNAPSGARFYVTREGYRILNGLEQLSKKQRQTSSGNNKTTRAFHENDEPFENLAYPLNPMMSTGMAYKGLQATETSLPYYGRFSSEWVVWAKEIPAHSTTTTAVKEPILLHCRLPLPQNRTEVQQLQRRHIARHHAAQSEALERWWHTAPPAYTSRCLYGDGEEALTGAERYYELCPQGPVSRVQHHRLSKLLRGSAAVEVDRKVGQQRKAKALPSVLDFLHQMHSSPSNRNAILRNPRYHGIFEEIGHYHPRYSKPRWNNEYLVWESWYPSTRPCATHYTTISSFPSSHIEETNVSSQLRDKIRPSDAYWKTVVRFRCPSEPPTNEDNKLSTWTVTEARQLCEYHVELMSELVCAWEEELDSFNVNPVLCVVLD